MAQIINTATIAQYQYPVGTTTKVIDTPISSTAVNELTDVVINFTKVCEPHYADIGDLITLTYTASNSTQAQTPLFSKISVQDNLFLSTLANVEIIPSLNVTNFNSTTGTFDFDLTNVGGTLEPTESISAIITLRLLPGADLTLNYNTTATATFTESTTQSTRTLSDTCNLQINNATLTINKTSSIPPTTPITCGQVLTYTTIITNTGNVSATILAGNFSDPIPAGTTFASSLSPANFSFNGTAVVNTTDIVIPAGSFISVTFNVTVNCPTF